MVPKHELPESIPLHTQGLNYGTSIYDWKIMLGKWDSIRTGPQSLGLQKNLFL
jgi:hypothetical protein